MYQMLLIDQYRYARVFLLIHLLISMINQFCCSQFGGMPCPKPILLLTQNIICDEERIKFSEYSIFKYFESVGSSDIGL